MLEVIQWIVTLGLSAEMLILAVYPHFNKYCSALNILILELIAAWAVTPCEKGGK
jgi:hypothetical protein